MPKYKVFIRQIWSADIEAESQGDAAVKAEGCFNYREAHIKNPWHEEWNGVVDIIQLERSNDGRETADTEKPAGNGTGTEERSV